MSEQVNSEGLFYPSFYIKEFDLAAVFFTEVFSKPQTDQPRLKGWKSGNTWLTSFPGSEGFDEESNPVNCEIAAQVETSGQVDFIYPLPE